MNSHEYLHIDAFKPYNGEEGTLVACDKDDPGACNFKIRQFVPNVGFSEHLEFDTLCKAQEILSALRTAHEMGGRHKLAELRAFLGVKQ